jgi:hypothetical protein
MDQQAKEFKTNERVKRSEEGRDVKRAIQIKLKVEVEDACDVAGNQKAVEQKDTTHRCNEETVDLFRCSMLM